MSEKLFKKVHVNRRDTRNNNEWHDNTINDYEVWVTIRDQKGKYQAMVLVNFVTNTISAIYNKGTIDYEAVHKKLEAIHKKLGEH